MPKDGLPLQFEFRGRSYRRTDRIVALGEIHMPLEHEASQDGQEVFLNRHTREIWGDLDPSIFLLNHHGDTVVYEEIYPEPARVLRGQTLAAVASLRRAGLFRNAGGRTPSQYHGVGSWSKALAFCETLKRINLFSRPFGAVLGEAQLPVRRVGRDWSVAHQLVFQEVEELLLPHSGLFVENDPSSTKSPPFGIIYQMVAQDLNHLLMEVEFSDFSQCRFYQQHLLPIYWDGHLLCGWKGAGLISHWKKAWDVPRGKFVVL